MRVSRRVLYCKSSPAMYRAELGNLKPCTLRVVRTAEWEAIIAAEPQLVDVRCTDAGALPTACQAGGAHFRRRITWAGEVADLRALGYVVGLICWEVHP